MRNIKYLGKKFNQWDERHITKYLQWNSKEQPGLFPEHRVRSYPWGQLDMAPNHKIRHSKYYNVSRKINKILYKKNDFFPYKLKSNIFINSTKFLFYLYSVPPPHIDTLQIRRDWKSLMKTTLKLTWDWKICEFLWLHN